MPIAVLVLVNTDREAVEDIVKILRKTENVREAYFMYGIYDVIVKVEADTHEEVKRTIVSAIRSLEGVKSTLSLIVSSPTGIQPDRPVKAIHLDSILPNG